MRTGTMRAVGTVRTMGTMPRKGFISIENTEQENHRPKRQQLIARDVPLFLIQEVRDALFDFRKE